MNAKSNTRRTGTCWLAFGAALVALEGAAATHTVSTVTALTNAIANANSGDTIVLAAGRYDLSTLAPYANGTSWGTMSTPDANAGKTCLWINRRLTIKGADNTAWHAKTREQESILDGGGVAAIFYCYAGGGRNTSFHHVTFENGVAESGKKGGAIYALGPAGHTANLSQGLVTNCVFRNCSASSGGGTYAYNVYDSLYENCRRRIGSTGAYSAIARRQAAAASMSMKIARRRGLMPDTWRTACFPTARLKAAERSMSGWPGSCADAVFHATRLRRARSTPRTSFLRY